MGQYEPVNLSMSSAVLTALGRPTVIDLTFKERSHMRKCRASAETAFDARDGHKTSLSDVVDLDGTAVRVTLSKVRPTNL
ncbi:hypothetical protein D918_08923 [Trichuris suis]|nr:hypothetical protein D918_08923 [Trichuris suis]